MLSGFSGKYFEQTANIDMSYTATATWTPNLEKYDSQLRTIGKSLEKGGDILFYGCDVAQGEVGDQVPTQSCLISRVLV